jgi:phage minor structural protein
MIVPAVTGASAAMSAILAGTGWTVGTVNPTSVATFQLTDYTAPLAALRSLPATFGGELYFDSVNKVVHLVTIRGTTTVPKLFYAHGKNLAGNERIVDTSQLTTRLRGVGAAGLDITGVNGNVAYIEDYTYYDSRGWPRQVKTQVLTNDALTDPNNLLSWAQGQLSTLSQPKITYNFNVALARADAMPSMGDVVRVWDRELGITANARVIGRTLNIIEPWKSQLNINTAAYNLLQALGLLGGTQYPGSANNAPNAKPAKGIAPGAPNNVVGTTNDYVDANGNHTTRIYATWNAVTLNNDGTPMVDFDHYESQFQRAGYTVWVPIGNTANTGVYTEDFKVGAIYQFRVRAVNKAGVAGAWTQISGTVAAPNATPSAPSAPILDANTFPLTIRATWNGNDYTGAGPPSDFSHIEVHISTTNGFTPSAATLVDTLQAAAVSPITGLVAGTTYYVVFRTVNVVGQVSGPSAQSSAVPRQVRDGEIVSLTVSKITVGYLQADVTMSARIKTADSGARVEMNSAGIFAYNSGGTNTVAIRNDGSAAFAGSLSGSDITGASGTFSGAVTGASIATSSSGSRFTMGPSQFYGSNAAILMYDSGGYLSGRITMDGGQGLDLISGDNNLGYSRLILSPSGTATFTVEDPGGSYVGTHTMGTTSIGTNVAIAMGATPSVNQAFSGGHLYGWTGGAWADLAAAAGSTAALYYAGGNTRLGCAGGSSINLQRVDGGAWASVNGGTYTNASTLAIKKNVSTLDDRGLELARQMRPVSYQLKDEHEATHRLGHIHMGFIAEEMHAILPEATPLGEEGEVIGINYSAIIPVLVKAIQELEVKVTELTQTAS